MHFAFLLDRQWRCITTATESIHLSHSTNEANIHSLRWCSPTYPIAPIAPAPPRPFCRIFCVWRFGGRRELRNIHKRQKDLALGKTVFCTKYIYVFPWVDRTLGFHFVADGPFLRAAIDPHFHLCDINGFVATSPLPPPLRILTTATTTTTTKVCIVWQYTHIEWVSIAIAHCRTGLPGLGSVSPSRPATSILQ